MPCEVPEADAAPPPSRAHFERALRRNGIGTDASPGAARLLDHALRLAPLGEHGAAGAVEARATVLPADEPAPDAGRRRRGLDSRRFYELAALRVEQGRTDGAIGALRDARSHAFSALTWLRIDPDFVSLRGVPPFESFIREGLPL